MSGSTFGELFRVTNFGESHGPAMGCIFDFGDTATGDRAINVSRPVLASMER